MNDFDTSPSSEAPAPQPPDRASHEPLGAPTGRGGSGRRLLGLSVLVLIVGALVLGVWRHYTQHRQVIATAEQQADFVPSVRVDEVMQQGGRLQVTLPATTLAFEQANIYARASGYIEKRFVDIGDHVKAGQILATITAPEVEQQVSQYQNALHEAAATLRQNEAQRALAQVTTKRSSILAREGWDTLQQGDTDRYNFQAQRNATEAAMYSAAAAVAQLNATAQQKIYQQVVAPFDGVITQRNIDVGSLITADAVNGTAMYAMVHSDVIRIWVYVPQDAAFGVSPGIDAIVRVPAMPNLTFQGKVTRVADALQPTTRTLLTEIDVANPDGALTPGTYCTVELQIPRKAPALMVPASAIIFNQNGMQVAVVDNGIVHLRKIAITTDFGTEVEVNEGVKDGEKVILQPPVNTADGDKVQIMPEAPSVTQ
jgi:RND family efflux transporter MFP subunit